MQERDRVGCQQPLMLGNVLRVVSVSSRPATRYRVDARMRVHVLAEMRIERACAPLHGHPLKPSPLSLPGSVAL
jgi:hypothetical protein